jgi:hypothetical protein
MTNRLKKNKADNPNVLRVEIGAGEIIYGNSASAPEYNAEEIETVMIENTESRAGFVSFNAGLLRTNEEGATVPDSQQYTVAIDMAIDGSATLFVGYGGEEGFWRFPLWDTRGENIFEPATGRFIAGANNEP